MSEFKRESLEWMAPEAKDMRDAFIGQLDDVIIGDQHVKEAAAVTVVTGRTLGLYGPVGGAKTTIALRMPELIGGIDQDGISIFPSNADATPTSVLGGNVSFEKRIEVSGVETIETQTSRTKGAITADTQVFFGDEFPRANEFTQNAVLSVLENNVIIDNSGLVTPMPKFRFGMIGANPAEAAQAMFKVPKAIASRVPAGVMMGVHNEEETIKGLWDGFEAKEKLEQVTDLEQLDKFKEALPFIRLDPTQRHLGEFAIKTTQAAMGALMDNHIDEAPGRMTKQIMLNAQALALTRGRVSVSESEIRDAAELVMTARMGLLGVRGARNVPLHTAIKDVTRGALGER